MTPIFTAKLGLSIRPTGIVVRKIDGSALKTYGIFIAEFLILDKISKIRFCERTFLLADTSMKIVLGYLF